MPTLDWIGKKAVVNHHRQVPYRLLHCDRELSAGDPDAGNLLVQGDNLEALKALLPYYAGQVKCIYIDPPFNTGNDWDYNDRVDSPLIRAWLNKTVGPEAEDLSRHDKWLCMMYPRLKLLKDLLRRDGFVFLHLDTNEIGNAAQLMDEVFGINNRLHTVAVTTRDPSGFGATGNSLFRTVNYILMYRQSEHATLVKQFEPKGYDSGYGKVIVNPNAPPNQWKWQPIAEVVSAANGYSSTREARRALSESLDDLIAQYAINNADRVFQLVAIGGGAAKKRAATIEASRRQRDKVFIHPDEDVPGFYIANGRQLAFYEKTVFEIDGIRQPAQAITDVWTDISWNGIAAEGGVQLKNAKKPEALIKRILTMSTTTGDLVVDSFAGSGTTAAVAHKLGRRWITIEMENYVDSVTAKRLRTVVEGDPTGISGEVGWTSGGGFRYCKLGNPLFDESGTIAGEVKFSDLAAHVFFTESGVPIPNRATGKSPLLGVHNGKAVYLLFNGVLGDKRANGGNVLTHKVLDALPGHDGPRVIYAEACRIGVERLSALGIDFKQLPYEIKTD